jgi:predicted small lipoprotein YifL
MKKTLALLMAMILAATMLAGCGPKTAAPTETPPATTYAAPSATAPAAGSPPAAAPVKTGLAVLTSIAKSADASETDGVAQADSLVVAVTVGADSKIVSCVIDQAQTKVNFSKTGELLTPLDTAFKTKNELGPEYGMAKASKIGKEWNQQAAAFARYVVGKTAEEVKSIAVKDGYAADADLTASVTVHVTDFIAGVAKAVEQAHDLGASATDKLGIGVLTNISKSVNAGDKDGLAQVYSTYSAVTKDDGGKITSCIIDASQANVNFDKTGKITTDITAPVPTKNELGDAYGMKKASGIARNGTSRPPPFLNT